MKKYLNQSDVIIDLHERGFNNDFQLFGTDLLWIQEKIFVRECEYSILEYHRLNNHIQKEVIIFGVLDHNRQTKGILLNHYANNPGAIPPVILKKLKEAGLHLPNIAMSSGYTNQNNYADEQESSKTVAAS